MQETDEMIITVLCFRLRRELNEVISDSAKANDYELLEELKELCSEFKSRNIDNEDEDLEDTLYQFLMIKIEELKEG